MFESLESLNDPSNWPRVNTKRKVAAQLAQGEHRGFDWYVIHNQMGHRNGYVRVNRKHPWYGLGMHNELIQSIDVHWGITYADKGLPTCKQRFSYHWILGFDTAHADDAPDPALAEDQLHREVIEKLKVLQQGTIRSQEYVINECLSLCDQAAEVAPWRSKTIL